MLYKLGKNGTKFDSIEPMGFEGLPKEKHLEDLIAQNLWDVLFEGNDLMPIKQERAWQPEADIYALNRNGDLYVFELKRDNAGAGAVHQASDTVKRRLITVMMNWKDSTTSTRSDLTLAYW